MQKLKKPGGEESTGRAKFGSVEMKNKTERQSAQATPPSNAARCAIGKGTRPQGSDAAMTERIPEIVDALEVVLTDLVIADHEDVLAALTLVMVQTLADSEYLTESQAYARLGADFAAAAAMLRAARAERRRQFKLRQERIAARGGSR